MNKLIIIGAALLMAGCVSVGYKPFSTMSGGYKDESLGKGKFFISYEMYGKVDPNITLERWHMRAKELCSQGYEVLSLERNDVHLGGELIPSDKIYEGFVQCKN